MVCNVVNVFHDHTGTMTSRIEYCPRSYGELSRLIGPCCSDFLPKDLALARTALGLTWLDELTVDAVDGFLMASLRAIEPTSGSGEL